MEYLNGVGILINPNRFEVIDKLSKSQLIILELRDIMDDQRIIVVNTYINPTYQRRLSNKIILEEISQALSTALINNRKIVICSDFNHEIKVQISHFNNFGLRWSSFNYTRPQSQNELDLIATNFDNIKFTKDYRNFMSDHEWIIMIIEEKEETINDLRQKKTSRKSIGKINLPLICEIINSSQSWNAIRERILERIQINSPNLQFSPKYVSICRKILRGEITVMNTRQRILKAAKSINNDLPSAEIWKISNELNEEMKKKESSFLQGIVINGYQICDPKKIQWEVVRFYNNKFNDENMLESNLHAIQDLFEQHQLEDHYRDIILDGISRDRELFPTNTTYGPDLLLPSHLKDINFRTELKTLIEKILYENKGKIPETALMGRLILLTKTGIPIAEISKTRPIVVQNLMIRLIEKVLKTKLDQWLNCHNMDTDTYQWGFTKKKSSLVNLIRVKHFIKANRKKRNINKPIILSLDIAGAFDSVSRKIILEAIRFKIKRCNHWRKWQRLWAMADQLLKPGVWIYEDNDKEIIKIQKGTPQGGWLSPMFFIIALDYILNQKDSITSNMLSDGKLLAFADDIIISIKPNEIEEIPQAINHIASFGLITNPSKCYYLSPKNYQELDKLAKHQNSIKYLGTWITYRKTDLTKKLKNSIKRNILKIRTFSFSLTPKLTMVLEQALYRTLALYHLGPAIITNEINFEDIKKITKSAEWKIKAIPACWNSELFQWINPSELTISWLRRTLLKQVLNLRNNETIKAEMSLWIWNDLYKTEFTGCMIWRQGYRINTNELNNLLETEVFRIVTQINKNIFYEIDHDTKYKFIWPCRKVWNKTHRLTWTTCPVDHLRLFSIKNHEIYYSSGSFDTHRYVKDIKIAKENIKNLTKIEVERVEKDMYDNYNPKLINVLHTLPWIKTKFEMVMQIKNYWNVMEGEEYKLFEDLCVDRNWRMFIPLPIEFDNKLIMESPKSNYFLFKNELKPNMIEEIDRKIEKFKISHLNNYFFHPTTIKKLANILSPGISHMDSNEKNKVYNNIEKKLYEYLY